MASEIKVVIVLKDGRGTVGIQSPECDPVFSTVEGDLVTIAAELPALVQLAEVKWSTTPKNPKAPIIEPPLPPALPAGSASGGKTKAKEETPGKSQPRWFE
jgi:hypothetical protein